MKTILHFPTNEGVQIVAAGQVQGPPTGLPSRLLLFLTPSTGLLDGRTFLLVLKKLHFWYKKNSDFYLFFVWIHCLIISSLQPVTKYMLFDN